MDTKKNVGQPPQTPAHPQVWEGQAELEHYRDLFEYAPVSYFVLNEEGQILEANRLGRQQLGHPGQYLNGRRFLSYLAEASRTSFEVFLRRVFASPDAQRLEFSLLQPGSESLQVLMEAVQCQNGQARMSTRAVITDISVLKHAQDSISAKNDALENLLERRTEQLRELNVEMETFVRAVTHQLQEPLRQASALAAGLQKADTLTPKEADQFSQTMLERVAYMTTLLDALDNYFWLGRQRAHFIPVSLERVLADVKKDLKPQLQGRRVIWYQEALPTVIGDSRSLQVIFRELLDNALKFSQERDPIQLSLLVRETATEYHIGVQDNGIGFNMRHKEKIFGIFTRLHSEQDYAGLGLGLPLVRRILSRHGGRVWVEGENGRGCTFWVALPKANRIEPR